MTPRPCRPREVSRFACSCGWTSTTCWRAGDRAPAAAIAALDTHVPPAPGEACDCDDLRVEVAMLRAEVSRLREDAPDPHADAVRLFHAAVTARETFPNRSRW